MTAIQLLIDLIKEFEGCNLVAYQCPAGKWTIGYGCTGKDIIKGLQWTQKQANMELNKRALEALSRACYYSPELINESPQKQAAIADFIFNCGAGSYQKSTLKKKVTVGDWAGAQTELMKWTKGAGKVLPGLVKRRKKEAALLG